MRAQTGVVGQREREMGELQKWEIKPMRVHDGLSIGNEEEGDVRVSFLF